MIRYVVRVRSSRPRRIGYNEPAAASSSQAFDLCFSGRNLAKRLVRWRGRGRRPNDRKIKAARCGRSVGEGRACITASASEVHGYTTAWIFCKAEHNQHTAHIARRRRTSARSHGRKQCSSSHELLGLSCRTGGERSSLALTRARLRRLAGLDRSPPARLSGRQAVMAFRERDRCGSLQKRTPKLPRSAARTWVGLWTTDPCHTGAMARSQKLNRRHVATRGVAPDDLYDYARAPARRPGRRVKDDLTVWTVTDDWPEDVPVTEAELKVFEAWFSDLFDVLCATATDLGRDDYDRARPCRRLPAGLDRTPG